MNEKNTETTERLQRLGNDCVAHLEKEAESLRKFLEHALAVQESVVNGDTGDEEKLNRKQELLEAAAAALQRERLAIHEKIGQMIGKPVEATSIRTLAKHVEPALADRLMEHRQIILDLTQSIESANRTNFMLIRQTIDLQQRLHLAITGQNPAAQTYGSSGQLNRATESAIIQTEC